MNSFLADYANSIGQGEKPFFSSSTRAAIREMAYGLDDLRVPYPPLQDLAFLEAWYALFPRLLASARAGKIKEARSLWPDMRGRATEN